MTVYAMLGGDPGNVAVQVQTAEAIAGRLSTGLTGLIVMPDPASAAVYVAGPDMVMTGSAGITAIQKAQESAIENLTNAFNAAASALGSNLATSIDNEVGEPALRAAGAAMLSHALVLPAGAVQTSHALNPAFEHVLMTAELPLILAPEAATANEACMIAWDGSPQAARAVQMNLDLIKGFSQVIIATHPDKIRPSAAASGCGDAESLSGFLREQGASPTTVTLSGDLSDSLLSAAADNGVSLIVMGAYGHSRIGEMLFGGTSRAMLHAKDRPSLALAH